MLKIRTLKICLHHFDIKYLNYKLFNLIDTNSIVTGPWTLPFRNIQRFETIIMDNR